MKNVMICFLCALYCLSPIDVLPEALLGPFGLPDDIIAIISAIHAIRDGKVQKPKA